MFHNFSDLLKSLIFEIIKWVDFGRLYLNKQMLKPKNISIRKIAENEAQL